MMFCNNCGNTLPEDTPFCPQCGTQLRSSGQSQTGQLLKRAILFLEQDDLGKADDYCEQVLDLEPENARAYVVKLMIRTKSKKEEDLAFAKESYRDWQSYRNALRFADDALKEKLITYLQSTEETIRIKTEEAHRQEQERLRIKEMQYKAGLYRDACRYDIPNASINDLTKAADLFRKIPGYLDSLERLRSCSHRLQELKKERDIQQLEQFRKTERRKRLKALLICVIVLALCVGAVLMYYAKKDLNARKAEQLYSDLVGMCFSGTYTNYTTRSSVDQFAPIDSMTKNDVSIQFLENKQVLIATTSYHGKGTYYTDKDGNRIWDNATSDTEVFSYEVIVSFWGDASVKIDNKTYQLNLDSSDLPHSLKDGQTTYS